MKLRRINTGAVVAVLLLVGASACQDKKQLAAAKGNAIAYAQARCECDKLSRKDPPGDLTLCTERMNLATRYLNINFELGKFSQKAREEVNRVGDQEYEKCIKAP